jgi:hypothetical protein
MVWSTDHDPFLSPNLLSNLAPYPELPNLGETQAGHLRLTCLDRSQQSKDKSLLPERPLAYSPLSACNLHATPTSLSYLNPCACRVRLSFCAELCYWIVVVLECGQTVLFRTIILTQKPKVIVDILSMWGNRGWNKEGVIIFAGTPAHWLYSFIRTWE